MKNEVKYTFARHGSGKDKAAATKADPRLVELVRFLARCAAERDDKLLSDCRPSIHHGLHNNNRKVDP